ncbi:MAG: ribosome maturation factor RimP [Acidimicrobiia bacterium]
MRSDDVSERVRVLLAPSLEQAGYELYDLEQAGSAGNAVLRVTIDKPGGVDLDAISDATRRVSAVLDQHDDLLPGRYLLEVSSPGIERPLRRPEHFRGALGATVALKTRAGTGGERRVEGVLEAAGDDGVVVAGRSIPYADIERARTRFDWPQPTPKPTSKGQPRRKAAAR